jgi:hypothetical protein
VVPIGNVTQELVATIDGLLLSLPIPLTPISWSSVDILTQRATDELKFKASAEGKVVAEKVVEAELQAAEVHRVKNEKEREQFISDNTTKALLQSPAGILTLLKKRLGTPMHTLAALLSRIPCNIDYKHRTLCMRAVHAENAPLGPMGKWDWTPNEVRSPLQR